MLILGLFSLPLQNGFIRSLETQADLYSLKSSKADVFISMMEKLAAKNLAELNPSKFIELMLYDHPPVGKRIEFARSFKKDEPR